MDKLVFASNQLSLKLLLAYRASFQNGNIFFSPFSIMSALAMVFSGAKASTKEEMEKILAIDSLDKEISTVYKCFQELQDGILLKITNILAVDEHYEILSEFSNNLKENYNAHCQSLDFAFHAETARKELNELIELATDNTIKDFFKPAVIDSLTILILANAIYFKGTWENVFDKEETKKKSFYTIKNKKIKIDMMCQKGFYKYFKSKDLDATFLEMPYLGNKLSMIVVLPKKKGGLPFVEKKITVEKLKDVIKKMSVGYEVHLSFPRFKLEENLPLKDCLLHMGMKEAFTEKNADFSGISGKKDLFVSDALHKAFIEVNEEGTVASAATACLFDLRCKRRISQPFCFTVDHPFLFFIQEIDSGLILFTGSIHNI